MKADLYAEGQYGQMPEPETVVIRRQLPGPVERLWAYLTEPEKRRRWLAGGPMGLFPGGEVTLVFRHTEITPSDDRPPEKYAGVTDGVSTTGVVTACEPPFLLAFTWDADTDHDSEVRFELTPEGDKVDLTVTHRRLVRRGQLISVAAGWHTHLAILESLLDGSAPPAFWRSHTKLEADYDQRLPRG